MNKRAWWVAVVFGVVLLLGGAFAIGRRASVAATFGPCVGAADCKVCKNCSRCKHCRSGGTCGVKEARLHR